MKHTLLLFCFCSAMTFAQTSQSVEPPAVHPNPPSAYQSDSTGPFVRHLKAHNARHWKGTKKVAAKVAEGAGTVVATAAVIPAIPVYFAALLIHCSVRDCAY